METKYKCDRCNQIFVQKCDFERHNLRKIPCTSKIKNEGGFTCPKCNKSYTRKDNLDRHISCYCSSSKTCTKQSKINQNPSVSSNQYNLNELKNTKEHVLNTSQNACTQVAPRGTSFAPKIKVLYPCNSCKKEFSRKFSLKRHLQNICKIKEEEKDNLVELLNAEIKQLKEELLSKDVNISNNTTNTTNNNMATNQQINNGTVNNNNSVNINNFYLLPYGKENMDHLKDNDYKFIINKGFNSVNTLLKKVHFNEKVPENHNVFIGNIKNGDISVFDGKVWNLKDKKEFLDDLYDNKKNMLVDKFEELEEDLPDFTVNKFMRFQNDEKSDKISGKLKKEMKFTLYNKRHMPLDIINKNKPIIEEDNNELQKLKLEFEEFKKQVLLNK